LTKCNSDFSFSRALASGLSNKDSVALLVATSHESEASVTTVYVNGSANIDNIKLKGGLVIHDVDAASLQSCEALSSYSETFDVAIWNFPCKSMETGADAQVQEIEENQLLLTHFFECVQKFLKPEYGQVHVTHKTFEPFCWWNIVKMAEDVGLHYEGSMVFDRYLYPGYINRKALENKSFPFHDAQVHTRMCF
jgi:25S rRNA (uracil2634-N3)-methyltransferase